MSELRAEVERLLGLLRDEAFRQNEASVVAYGTLRAEVERLLVRVDELEREPPAHLYRERLRNRITELEAQFDQVVELATEAGTRIAAVTRERDEWQKRWNEQERALANYRGLLRNQGLNPRTFEAALARADKAEAEVERLREEDKREEDSDESTQTG
jgi:hypothetical protein